VAADRVCKHLEGRVPQRGDVKGIQAVVQTLLVLLLTAGIAEIAGANPHCTPLGREIPLQSMVASAGFFANLRNADHSVRARTDKLLKDARAAAKELELKESRCVRSCARPVVAVLFNSTPYRHLNDYQESAQCQALLESTSNAPIVYENRRFSSDDDAREWYEDLTQGDGVDGDDLYQRCPGACSPAYSSVAYREGDEFVVSTTIICGHARDRDDGQYRLSAGIRWICP
jgi:hypothetical protein